MNRFLEVHLISHTINFFQSQIGYILGILLIILSIETQFGIYLNQDIAWNIHVAEQMLAGKKLYIDFVDPNTPLIFYWAMLPVMLSQVISLDVILSSHLIDILVAIFCILISGYTLKYTTIGKNLLFNQLFKFTICAVIFFLPLCMWANSFFNKDVMTIPFLLPYLLLALGRIEDAKPPNKITKILVGLMAGFGFCIKPYFVIMFIVLELAIIFKRRDIKSLKSLETLVITIFITLYLIFIFVFHPEYITDTLPIIMFTHPLYSNPTYVVMVFFFVLILPALATLTLTHFLPVCTYKGFFSLILSLFLMIAIMQNKGWAYQVYPAMAMGYILLVKIIVDILQLSWNRRLIIKYSFIIFLCSVILYDGIYGSYKRYDRIHNTHRLERIYSVRLITKYINSVKKDNPNVLILSEFLHHTYPAISYSKGETFFALPFMFPITAIENFKYLHQNDDPEWVETKIKPIREFMYQKVNQYLKQYKPDIIIARNQVNFHMRRTSQDINIIDYLSDSSEFNQLMANYSQSETSSVTPYDVYYRK